MELHSETDLKLYFKELQSESELNHLGFTRNIKCSVRTLVVHFMRFNINLPFGASYLGHIYGPTLGLHI